MIKKSLLFTVLRRIFEIKDESLRNSTNSFLRAFWVLETFEIMRNDDSQMLLYEPSSDFFLYA